MKLSPWFAVVAALCFSTALHAQNTAFTYQGRLNDNGAAATGSYDLRFTLYDAVTNGSVVGNAQTNAGIVISNGLFTAQLDFGANVFNGSARWLDIGVRTNGAVVSFVPLTPRQPLTASPYAIQAVNASTSTTASSANAVAAANITGTIPNAKLPANVALLNGNAQFNGIVGANNFAGNGSLLTNLSLAAINEPGVFGLGCNGFTLAYIMNLGIGTYPKGLATADLNGDGRTDLVSGHQGVQVALNNGSGLGPFSGYGGFSPGDIMVADFNSDGKPDIAYADADTLGKTTVLTNTGSGTFSLAWQKTAGDGFRLCVADMNGDGKPDLIFPDSVEATVYTNDGNANFTAWRAAPSTTTYQGLAVGDLNGDGKPDIIKGTQFSLVVFTNGPTGFDGAYTNNSLAGASVIRVGDVNGDGRMDLLVGTGNKLSILINNGNATFTTGSTINGSLLETCTLADVNHDGIADLATVWYDGPEVARLYTNNGAGTFGSFSAITIGGNVKYVAAGDFNNDGWNEVIAGDYIGSKLTVLAPLRVVTGVFAGNGSQLTNLSATSLTGTVSDNNLSANVARLNANQTFSGINTLNNSGNSFSGSFSGNGGGLTNLNGSGANLSNLNASNLSSGIVADARLSSNVALLNANQTFAGTNTFSNPSNSFSGTFTGSGAWHWLVVSGTTVQAQPNAGYLLTNNAQVTVTLPSAPALGDVVRVTSSKPGGWKIAQNTNQTILAHSVGNTVGTAWTAQNSGSNDWGMVASSSDGTKLIAGTYSSRLYTSTDGGLSWIARSNGIPSGGIQSWRSVASSSDGTKLVATPGFGGVYTSADSGATWTNRLGNANRSVVCSSSDGTKLFCAGVDGMVASTNSGASWTTVASAPFLSAMASSVDAVNLVGARGDTGDLYTSTNSGVTWLFRTNVGGNVFVAVASSGDGSKLAAAVYGGQIFTSSDAGATWVARNAGTQNWLSLTSSTDGTKLAAVANSAQIYISTDLGLTWTARESGRSWTGIACSSDGSKLVAVVNNGLIYTSVPMTTPGVSGYLQGNQNSSIELQYLGNNQFLPISSTGVITAF
jgi:hypothetical protein